MFILPHACRPPLTFSVILWLSFGLVACGDTTVPTTDTFIADTALPSVADSASTDSSAASDTPVAETHVPPDSSRRPPPDTLEPPQWELTAACDGAADLVYQTPENALSEDVPLGTVVRCTTDPAIDAASVKAAAAPLGLTTSQGVEVLRIAYRTKRGENGPGVGTAHVFLKKEMYL